MASKAQAAASPNSFVTSFVALSIVSGISIGMGKIVTTLFAISLGADAFQVGIISAMESVGMVLVTVPAGFVIARYGPRSVYFLASLGPLLVNIAMPWMTGWHGLALSRGLIGLCIPFRIVSMNSSFLDQLKHLGLAKAGWYRGSLTLGIALLGPAAATFFTHRLSYFWCFLIVAVLFGVMALFSLSFFPARIDTAAVAVAREPAGMLGQIGALLRNRDVSESCAIEFASSATNALFSTFIILVAISLPHLHEQDGINVMLVQGATSVAVLFLAGPILQQMDKWRSYALGLTLALVALATLGLANGFLGLALGAVLLSGGSALIHLINMMLLSRQPGEKSKISGLYNLAQMLGSSAGAILGGLLSKIVPIQSVFLIWVPLLLAGAAILWTTADRSRQP